LGVATALVAAGDWLALSTLARLAWLAGIVCGGAALYFGACFAVGLRAHDFKLRS
jgi:hypothetical protein